MREMHVVKKTTGKIWKRLIIILAAVSLYAGGSTTTALSAHADAGIQKNDEETEQPDVEKEQSDVEKETNAGFSGDDGKSDDHVIVAYDKEYEVPYACEKGSTLEEIKALLPAELKVTLKNGEETVLPVTWVSTYEDGYAENPEKYNSVVFRAEFSGEYELDSENLELLPPAAVVKVADPFEPMTLAGNDLYVVSVRNDSSKMYYTSASGSWFTRKYYIRGSEDNRMEAPGNTVAYCGNPAADNPYPGWYTPNDITRSNIEVSAAIWYGYGAPGFDASMWPSAWYDGTLMNEERYKILSHIVLADIYAQDGMYAYAGQGDFSQKANRDFREWVQNEVIGCSYVDGHIININAIRLRIGIYGYGLTRSAKDDVPPGFTAYEIYTGPKTQNILSYRYIPKGFLTMKKTSTEPSVTDGNANYNLQGAWYGVYKDKACTQAAVEGFLASIFFIDENGKSGVMELPTGTYYVKEGAAPKGYELDQTVYTVQVTEKHTATVPLTLSVRETPQTGKAAVSKKSANTAYTDGNPCYSLEGAVYTLYRDAECKNRVTTMTTDAKGYAVSGNLAVGTYYVKETAAPKGYLLCDGTDGSDKGVHIVTVKAGETATFTCKEPPAYVTMNLKLQKMDQDTKEPLAQGCASLEGAVFELAYYTNMDGKTDGTPAKKWHFTTDAAGTFSCNENIPVYLLGTYSIKEVKAPTCYQLKGTMNFVQNPDGKADVKTGLKMVVKQPSNGSKPQIYDGESVISGEISAQNLTIHAYDEIYKGSIRIIKHTSDTNKPLAGVTFRLMGLETGTEMTGVTDENGEIVWENLVPQRYVVTEISTVDGYSLLKDNIEITLPVGMTPQEAVSDGADISQAVYNEATGKYEFYDVTYTIGETVTFQMPMTGENQIGTFVLLVFALTMTGSALAIWYERKNTKRRRRRQG